MRNKGVKIIPHPLETQYMTNHMNNLAIGGILAIALLRSTA